MSETTSCIVVLLIGIVITIAGVAYATSRPHYDRCLVASHSIDASCEQ